VRKTAKKAIGSELRKPAFNRQYAILLFNSDAVKLLIESNGKDRQKDEVVSPQNETALRQ
jgi:hypothetical protein